MAVAVSYVPPVADELDSGIKRRHWTREEFYRAAELGLGVPVVGVKL